MSVAFNAGGDLVVDDSANQVVEEGVLDATPPLTTATGLQQTGRDGWTTETAVTVTLTATDTGSGVAATCYRIDSGAYATYDGPFSVTTDGSHRVDYYSTDIAGNTETVKTGYVNIDTAAPTTTMFKAPGLTLAGARKGRTLKIGVRIADRQPGCGRASLRLVLTTIRGRKLATLIVGSEPTNKALTLSDRLTRTLARGSYCICVTATDAAGNVQGKVGRTRFAVK
jgi:hypothetical protein